MNRTDRELNELYNEILAEVGKEAGITLKNLEEYDKKTDYNKDQIKKQFKRKMSDAEFLKKIDALNELIKMKFGDYRRRQVRGDNDDEKVLSFFDFGYNRFLKKEETFTHSDPATYVSGIKKEEEKEEEKEDKEEDKEKDKEKEEEEEEKDKDEEKNKQTLWQYLKEKAHLFGMGISVTALCLLAIGIIYSSPIEGLIACGVVGSYSVINTIRYLFKGKKGKSKKIDAKALVEKALEEELGDEMEETKTETKVESDVKDKKIDKEVEIDADKLMGALEKEDVKEEDKIEKSTILEMKKDLESKMERIKADQERLKEDKLSIEEDKDKIRRTALGIEGVSLETLKEELKVEKERMDYWIRKGRESAIDDTKERINLINSCIRKNINTNNILEINSKRLKFLNSQFKDKVSEMPGVYTSIPEEILDLKNDVLSEFNTEMIYKSKERLIEQLKMNLSLETNKEEKEWLETEISSLEIDNKAGCPTNATKRLEDLRKAKANALHSGDMEFVRNFDEEISEIEKDYDSSKSQEEMQNWAMNRVIELQKAQIIADRIGDNHLIGSYQQEIETLQSKYDLTIQNPKLNDEEKYTAYPALEDEEIEEESISK